MKANTCKRLLALLACLAVLCACLAGCGGKDSGGASKDPAPASDGNEGGAAGSGGYKACPKTSPIWTSRRATPPPT